ncbi:transposase [Nitrosomonas sp.]|uniref:transposase n=1 Tax=Nitrosomonas sp. TaxID=42353 RepID=UPI0025F7A2F8|nr:transposase [Nitrosomonas sp.]
MANANLHVMRFLGLSLENDIPDHSVLSRFRARLTQAHAWRILQATVYNLKRLPRLYVNRQIQLQS